MRPFQPSHLYVQVRNEIARRIARQEYPPGSSLPNEFSLSSEMQVSVGTVRKAIEMLGAERLLTRSQGRGTIVADRQSAEFRGKFDRFRTSGGAPIAWKFHEREREVRNPDEIERDRLRLSKSQQIISIRRLRETGGEIIKCEHSRLPFEVFGDLGDLAAEETTIENLSFLRGVHISAVDERLTQMKAPEKIAAEFNIPVDTTIIRLERMVYDGGGNPVEWRIAYCNLGDRQYLAPSPIGVKEAK